MIEKLCFRGFKSLEDVTIEPGAINVLIGANGSGKSNLLEAIGVLSAAAQGRVDDAALLRRGVRPGVPALYKCSLSGTPQRAQIYFGAWNSRASYEVSLYNPIAKPFPAWRYQTEKLGRGSDKVIGRGPRMAVKYNPEAGLAALKSVEMKRDDLALHLLNELRDFAIYCPETATLRGLIPDPQSRLPIGLAGGQLPKAVSEMLRAKRNSKLKIRLRALALIDWAMAYETVSAASMPLSPSIGTTQEVIKFTDRYMKAPNNILSGYEASEGALYVLFHAVLATHPQTPPVYAVDNADHALNPRLARELLKQICLWNLGRTDPRQIFLTTQNPLSLDGLPLQDDRVKLFTVSRTERGRTTVRRVVLGDKLKEKAERGWTLSRLWVMGHLGGVPNV